MINKYILGSEENRIKSAYLWNAVGGLLNAGQSAFILIVLSRTNPAEDAGVFAIAYAIASLTMSAGKFGIRNYQASDVTEEYTFSEYKISRVVSSFLMVGITMFYLIRGRVMLNYSIQKLLIIFLMGLLKLTDVVEDVFHGRLQQMGRLDIGARCMTMRYIGIFLLTTVTLILTHNLIVTMLLTLVFSWTFFAYTCGVFKPYLFEDCQSLRRDASHRYFEILKDCFPIAFGGFLMIYIANAPKYAIDANMNETYQACFNYIFMPVYVINTLSTFIFQPTITKMAFFLEKKDKKSLLRLFARQLLIVFVICVIIVFGGYYMGIPVLSFLYNTPLIEHKYAFVVLLVGGCFLAFSSFFAICITIFRKQKWLMAGYVLPALVELIISNHIVQLYGMNGAAWMYTLLIGVQMLMFGGLLLKLFLDIRIST